MTLCCLPERFASQALVSFVPEGPSECSPASSGAVKQKAGDGERNDERTGIDAAKENAHAVPSLSAAPALGRLPCADRGIARRPSGAPRRAGGGGGHHSPAAA